MAFQGTAIPNLIIEVAGIMICLFALITIWYGSPKYTTTKRFMTAAFSSMLAYNLCLLFLEFSQAAAGNRWRTGVILVAFGTYLFPLIAAYIVSLFVAATVGKNRQEYRWLFRILTILAGTGIIALILAQLTGNLVLADDAGRFSYGAASSLGFVVTAMFMIIDLIMLLRLGQNITPRQRNAFIAYLSLPLLSIPVRRLWPGVYVVALASCILFKEAWKVINEVAGSWPVVPECEGCAYAPACNRCAATMLRYAEPGKQPIEMCEQVKFFVQHGVWHIPDC